MWLVYIFWHMVCSPYCKFVSSSLTFEKQNIKTLNYGIFGNVPTSELHLKCLLPMERAASMFQTRKQFGEQGDVKYKELLLSRSLYIISCWNGRHIEALEVAKHECWSVWSVWAHESQEGMLTCSVPASLSYGS